MSVKNNLINGQWTAGASTIPNINPSNTNDIIGEFAQASSDQVEFAVASAKAAQPAWARTPLEAKQAALMKIGNALMERCDELGRLLAREEGKPFAEGRGEVYRAGQFFTYYAAEVLRQGGENFDSVREGVDIDIRREPMGVIAVISPWNFPTATASWKIAPALAYGNSVIWKPANLTPASAVALAEIIHDSGIPAGVFNLVMGGGGSVGQRLIEHKDIGAVTFTGSYETGIKVAQAAASNLTKFQLELGSKNALLVMDDCDLDLAVATALGGAYFSTGQKCTASSRLIVHANLHDAFVEKLSAQVAALKVGDALTEGTQIGPAASDDQLQSNLRYMALAKEEGCELVTGGDALTLENPGFYMQPALFINTRNDMRVNREEMFAPIACVQKVEDYEQGLAIVNDTDYGLTAGIMTNSLSHANHFRRNAETGCVMVNLPTAGTDYHVPFGGRKNSSFGSREQGKSAAEFYTQVKTCYIKA
jgi:aldehyde dehydrogenase (NAD+)